MVEAGDPGIFAMLDDRLEEAVRAVIDAAQPVTLLYSGGVDSTLIALALRGRVSVDALVVGLGNGRDPERARSAAGRIGLPLRDVRLEDSDVRRIIEEERGYLPDLLEPARSVQVALALAVRASRTRRILTGQGADELFGGYAHFRGLTAAGLEFRRSEDLGRLLSVDWPLSREIAAHSGHDLRSPYLEPGFLGYARTLPMEPAGPEGPTKTLLRRWAVHRGVPEVIATEPKHAMQYGSGIAAAVRRLDHADGKAASGSGASRRAA